MMSKGHKFLAILYATIAILIAGASTYFVSDYMYNNELGFPSEVEFVLDEEVDLVVGEKYQLTPYIINEDEDIEYGQYLYSSDSSCVTVSDTGLINVLSLPEKEVLITVTELSRNLSKTVKLNITRGINGVFNIETSASEMLYNAIYEYKVTFLPQDADITDFVSFQTTDSKGNVIDEVFELEVLGNVLKFKTNGLGKGKLSINIKSEKDLVNYTKEFDFNISLEDKILSNDITNENLLGVNELAQIDTLYFTGDVLDVSDLSLLPNLKDVALTNSSNVCLCENLSQKYKYHVKDNLYSSYYEQINLGDDFFRYVEPYNTSILTDKFVVYYDTRSDEVSCSQVLDFFKFNKLEEVGYKHIGWSLERNNETKILNESDVYNSNANSIVVYSMFKPIEYVMSFNSSMLDTNKFLENVDYTYKDEVVVRLSDGFKNYIESVKESVPGYKFVGWSSKVKESKILRPEEFGDLIDFNLLESNIINLDKPLTYIDGTVITYYDVWQPITYNVTFDISEYSNEFTKVNDILNSTYYYDDLVDITGFEVMGYNLRGWNHKGNMINKINELTSVENQEVVLTPVLEAKEYTVWIKIPKVDSNGERYFTSTAEYDNFVATVTYDTDLFAYNGWFIADSNGLSSSDGNNKIENMPVKVGKGYLNYNWFINTNSNVNESQDSNEPTCLSDKNNVLRTSLSLRDFMYQSKGNMLSVLQNYDGKSIDIRLNGSKELFYVEFDLDGGQANQNGLPLTLNNGNYGFSDTISISDVTKTGYTHTGWSIKQNENTEKTYNGTKISIQNGKISINDIEIDIVIGNGNSLQVKACLEANTYTVSFNSDGGTAVSSQQVTYDSAYGTLQTPSKNHYEFKGWYYGDVKVEASTIANLEAKNHTLTAKWEQNEFVLTISASNTTVTVKDASSNTITSGSYVKVGTKLTITYSANTNYQNPTCTFDDSSISSGAVKEMPKKDVTISASSTAIPTGGDDGDPGTCIAAGTMITMADGSKRAVEDIRPDDKVISYNHITGKVISNEVIIVVKTQSSYYKNTFVFDDGTRLVTINEHGIFDYDLAKYVNIDAANYEMFIGHRFVSIDSNFNIGLKRLVSVESVYETGYKYDIVTNETLNYVAEDTLSVTHVLVDIINTFEFDNNLKYDLELMQVDIEKYGLFTYEDFKDYCDVEAFEQYNMKIAKVGIAKGLYTKEYIISLINDFVLNDGVQIK